ncbi:protein lethal(2)essential for life-like [Cylas formicarius]|uniref:protein lethal(2)essential for life-like n=1 Tax=Cylas formicarius TaxID=197179 RepID=UPI0029589036|nr:protein lethal(2)essential for life-like [Cylas formicarius]
MSLLPLLFGDQHQCPVLRRPAVEEFVWPLQTLSTLTNTLNQLAQLDKDTSITIDKDHFQANIDVQQFKPEEITVKFSGDNTVTVEGKHEEKQDEHGFISRHFVRRYVLPDDVDAQKLQSKLSSDGVLSIAAPKKPEGKQLEYREIPVQRTGPVKNVEQKSVTEGEKKK